MATSNSTDNIGNEPEAASSLSGWSEFFSHISSFLRTCGRQYGLANERFAEYAIEHLTVISNGVSNILQIVEEANMLALIEKLSNS